MFETVAFACCVVLMPTEKAQLISSASVTAFFLALSVWTRPYVENIEDWLDIAGRIFLLATLGVGIALMGDDNSGGQVVCDVILAVIVLASNALFVFVLNPRKLLRGVVKAIHETRAVARAAGWNEDAIEKMSSKELAEITADDVKGCSSLQVWWLLQYHRESAILRDDVFSSMTELNLSGSKVSGKSHTFLPLSDRHNR